MEIPQGRGRNLCPLSSPVHVLHLVSRGDFEGKKGLYLQGQCCEASVGQRVSLFPIKTGMCVPTLMPPPQAARDFLSAAQTFLSILASSMS